MSKQPGASLGESISRILAETIMHAAHVTVPHKAEHTRRAIDGWLDEAEESYAPKLAAMFEPYLAADGMPEGLRGLLETMGNPDHQFDVLLQIIGFISAVFGALFQLGRPEQQQLLNQLWTDNQAVPLSPADLADMVERAIVGNSWAQGEAAKSGISAERFELLVQDTGEPPGLEQMLSLWRRGLLDQGTLDKMIAYSRVRLEWLDYVKLLAHDTMTQGDAIEGALKGVLDQGTAQGFFVEAGGLAEQFGTLLQIAGNPIGVESALNLLNHGFISEAQARQVILHSRINPIFEDMALLQRFRFLSPFQVVNAVKGGAATKEQGIAWLTAEGYPVDQVTAVVGAAAAGKVQTHKDITEAQIAVMFETGAITHADASARLVHLGYDAGEVDFILAVYDERRHLTMVQGAINQIRKVYLAGRVDDTTAGTQLDALGVDPEAKGIYLTVWGIERASELRELTAPQIGAMYKKGLFTDADAVARWESMGYARDDALLLLANYGGPPPANSPAAQAPPSGATGTTGP